MLFEIQHPVAFNFDFNILKSEMMEGEFPLIATLYSPRNLVVHQN